MRTSWFLCLVALVAVACGPSSRDVPDDDSTDEVPAIDAATVPGGPDARVVADAGACPNQGVCPNEVPDGCGTEEICNNGLDDNCNNAVDEGCGCTPGSVQACFLGPPGHRNIGSCSDGTQRCVQNDELGFWGDCTGGITPTNEACDSQDNDCNGCVDDSDNCCDVSLHCPGPGDMPEGQPFAAYPIDGTTFYNGTVTSWHWTVTGGPCDQLLAPSASFTLAGQTSPSLTFTPTLSGDYTVRVEMTLPGGDVIFCEFIVHVRGPGLRAELCWDTDGQADIDLHVHRPDDTGNWFTEPSDCYYADCKGQSYADMFGFLEHTEWGAQYENSPLADCVGGPDGADWQMFGACHNPRLDIDNIAEVGKAENINIDKPENGKSYRVAVHYYGGNVATHPLVNVYCGGVLVATYGAAPDVVPGFTVGGADTFGPFWQVVDVTPTVDAMGVTTSCALAPLHPAGGTTGYKVICPDDESCANDAFN
jgi:hypothetical protein